MGSLTAERIAELRDLAEARAHLDVASPESKARASRDAFADSMMAKWDAAHAGATKMGDGASGNRPAPVCREAETAASPVEPGVDTGTVAACESCGGRGTRSYDMAGMRINGAVCKVCNGTGKAPSDPAVCGLCGELLVAGKCITAGCSRAPAPSGGDVPCPVCRGTRWTNLPTATGGTTRFPCTYCDNSDGTDPILKGRVTP